MHSINQYINGGQTRKVYAKLGSRTTTGGGSVVRDWNQEVLLPMWSQVRALWLLIWWSLEAYMVVNFRAREISQGTHKLARTPTLNWKKKILIIQPIPKKVKIKSVLTPNKSVGAQFWAWDAIAPPTHAVGRPLGVEYCLEMAIPLVTPSVSWLLLLITRYVATPSQ
jgi:hypothetical protein